MKKLMISILLILSSIAYLNIEAVAIYTAKLSSRDYLNSNGEKLATIAKIIRQDRANYHSFKISDDEN
ncbi:hypothetical protein VSU16_16595 (plasmid) [Cetobacterium somerae]|uniref:hypothetical protein n=1 Tax=Cetobacterium somerae TaxID=188913 RepID=UPI002E7B5D6D|nr:hypothetical protein [Cetobacterium somerae]WVJ03410.1 hypothetical protein VSU16_16595 [Cetobacterium somerae]